MSARHVDTCWSCGGADYVPHEPVECAKKRIADLEAKLAAAKKEIDRQCDYREEDVEREIALREQLAASEVERAALAGQISGALRDGCIHVYEVEVSTPTADAVRELTWHARRLARLVLQTDLYDKRDDVRVEVDAVIAVDDAPTLAWAREGKP